MCLESSDVIVIFTVVSAIATAVIAHFTYINIQLTKEIKKLQIVATASIIYSSQHHGANYSENDYGVIYNRIKNYLEQKST